MKKVFHVVGQDVDELDYIAGMDIFDGDVYGFDDPDNHVIWIWIGKDSSVEEHTVGAWLMNKVDQDRGGTPEVITIKQGEEPMAFNESFSITIVDDDTPGFLRKAELDIVEFKLHRVYIEVDTDAFDDALTEEVPLSRKSLKSNDVFVLDGNEAIYCWIGKDSQIEEKRMGQKVMQKMDVDRHYLPLQYTIYEGDGDKNETAFYELLDKLEKMAPEDRKAISVEDQRELQYVAEEAKTVEEHKQEIDQSFETTDPSEVPERIIQAGTDEHKEIVASETPVDVEETASMGTVAASIAATKATDTEENLSEPSSKQDMGSTAEKISETTPDMPPALSVQQTPEPSEMRSIPTETKSEPSPEMQVEESSEQIEEIIEPSKPEPEEESIMSSETPKMVQTTPSSQVVAQKRTTTFSAPQTQPRRDVSPSFGGAPVPEISDLDKPEEVVPVVTEPISNEPAEPISGPEEGTKVNHKIDTNCMAIRMHTTVWSSGNSCSVCGMVEKDCPDHENHRDYLAAREPCPICKATRM